MAHVGRKYSNYSPWISKTHSTDFSKYMLMSDTSDAYYALFTLRKKKSSRDKKGFIRGLAAWSRRLKHWEGQRCVSKVFPLIWIWFTTCLVSIVESSTGQLTDVCVFIWKPSLLTAKVQHFSGWQWKPEGMKMPRLNNLMPSIWKHTHNRLKHGVFWSTVGPLGTVYYIIYYSLISPPNNTTCVACLIW